MNAVNYNGTLLTHNQWTSTPDRMLQQPYVYQRIHTLQYHALHLAAHLEILNRAAEDLWGRSLQISCAALQGQISELLNFNRYPAGSNEVTLRFFPQGIPGLADEGEPGYLLETSAQMLYSGYRLWHTRPLLTLCPCSHPWEGYPTGLSLLCGSYGKISAGKNNDTLAVVENQNGILTHIDNEPLVLRFGSEILITPLHQGVPDSVLRRLLIRICREEKVTVNEEPLVREWLTRCDEAFTVSSQGIISLLGFGDYRYYSLMAHRLSEHLAEGDLREF